MEDQRHRVCPVERAGTLDNRIRRWLQEPRRIVSPFVREGMTVLDVGCGPGFFTIEMAGLVGPTGKVIAADLQEGMLEKLRAKIRGTELERRIDLVKCEPDRLNVTAKVDFALTFYMVHEVPDQAALFTQIAAVVKDSGQLLLVEPKMFHVSRKAFQATIACAERAGFAAHPGPRLLLSWSAVLRHAGPADRAARRSEGGR